VIPSAKASVWRIGKVRRAYCTPAGPEDVPHERMCGLRVCQAPDLRASVCKFRTQLAQVGLHRGGAEEGLYGDFQHLRSLFQMQACGSCERGLRGHQARAPHFLPYIELQAQRGGRAFCKAARTPWTSTTEPMNTPSSRYHLGMVPPVGRAYRAA